METKFIFRVSVRLSAASKRQGTISEKKRIRRLSFNWKEKSVSIQFFTACKKCQPNSAPSPSLSLSSNCQETILHCRQFSRCPVVNSLVRGLLHLPMVETA